MSRALPPPAILLAADQHRDAPGEVLAPHWEEVDLDSARLSTRHAILNVAYELVVVDVKTATVRRTIELDPRAVAVLPTRHRAQLEERVAFGQRLGDDGPVFAARIGGPRHPDHFSHVFGRPLAKSMLSRIRLHDLRHTAASILQKAGVSMKVVSERLVHSSPARSR
jgi:integrase